MTRENFKIAIISLRAGAQWELNGNTYADLVWLDERQSKPTEEEVNSMIQHLIATKQITE